MVKRVVAGTMWFVSIWWAYALVASMIERPPDGGAVLGALVAAFVILDPAARIWGRRTSAPAKDARPDRLGVTAPTA